MDFVPIELAAQIAPENAQRGIGLEGKEWTIPSKNIIWPIGNGKGERWRVGGQGWS